MNVHQAIEEWPNLSFGRKKEILVKIVDCYLQAEEDEDVVAQEEIRLFLKNAQLNEQDDYFGTEGLRA